MRAAVLILILPTPALAHWGHIGEAAGHGHWVAGAILGGAVLAGVLGALKGKKKEAEEAEPEGEEAPA